MIAILILMTDILRISWTFLSVNASVFAPVSCCRPMLAAVSETFFGSNIIGLGHLVNKLDTRQTLQPNIRQANNEHIYACLCVRALNSVQEMRLEVRRKRVPHI